jgi:MoaA/NifB/PqqE/SkfB family radical SAM enzyme
MAKSELRDPLDTYMDETILPMLRQGPAIVSVTGSGDSFASKHFRRALPALTPEEYPGVRLVLLTNGLLLSAREWQALGPARTMVQTISVSIDAATDSTYEDVRRPGKWPALLESMQFIGALRQAGEIRRLVINFVVQAKNFREMPDFVELGEAWGADRATFQRLWSFGAYEGDELADDDIVAPSHPLHGALLEILTDPRLKNPIASLSNILD